MINKNLKAESEKQQEQGNMQYRLLFFADAGSVYFQYYTGCHLLCIPESVMPVSGIRHGIVILLQGIYDSGSDLPSLCSIWHGVSA